MLNTTPCLTVWLLVLGSSVLTRAQESPRVRTTNSNLPLASIVEQMEKAQAGPRPAVSYEVIREYRLFGDKRSNPSSEVRAEVDYVPPNQKSFVIQKHAGSSRGEDVVRRILQRESQMAGGSGADAAIDSNNYSFGYLGETTIDGNACYLLSLNPKRKESELIRGMAWVDKRSFLVRHIEGQMAKNPSWLLKKVDLKIDFADIGGVWLQADMQAAAEVRFIGSQTLESQTIDARVGNLVAWKTTPATPVTIATPNLRRLPAIVIIPLDQRQ